MLTVILSQNKFNSITCLTFSNNKKRKGERERVEAFTTREIRTSSIRYIIYSLFLFDR